MAQSELFNNGIHRNILLEDYGHGEAVQANQHLVVHGNEAIILDPGGHKVFAKVLADSSRQIAGKAKIKYIFFSHQDPDIVAAANGWLMTTQATAYAPNVWLRFIPHFGVDDLVVDQMKGIPDEGMRLNMGGAELIFLPAHYLHSCGNYQVYDPIAKILYTGDLGASLGMEYFEVSDFDNHLQYMTGFHQRYMTSQKAMSAWAEMVRQLDIEIIAPQHGAYFKGKQMVKSFIDWCDNLACGLDLNMHLFKIPS
jgi:flavorubredoxin